MKNKENKKGIIIQRLKKTNTWNNKFYKWI